MAAETLSKSGIYSIRNIVSGRVYVGSAVTIVQRWNAHRHQLRKGAHHSKLMQRSWNKHGEAAFVFEILEPISDVSDLITREQHWIDSLNAACPERGFNISPTAGSPLGTKHSSETKAKHSAYRKGRKLPPHSAETRAKLSAQHKGMKASAEVRAKMSASQKGKKRPPRSLEHCQNISRAKLGKRASAEARASYSAARKGRPLAPRHAANVRAALIKRNKQRGRARPGSGQLSLPL